MNIIGLKPHSPTGYTKVKQTSMEKVPIYMRIAVGDNITQLSTGIYISAVNWQLARQEIGKKEPGYEISNLKLCEFSNRFNWVVKEYLEKEIEFSSEMVKNKIIGKDVQYKILLAVVKEHNTHMYDLIGKDYAQATYKRFITLKNLITEFLQLKHKQSDYLLSGLSNKFLIDFELFLKTVRNCNHNSTAKYVKNFKRVVNYAIANGWIRDNPFVGHKITIKATKTIFFTEAEIAVIEEKQFGIERLDTIKSIFLFNATLG